MALQRYHSAMICGPCRSAGFECTPYNRPPCPTPSCSFPQPARPKPLTSKKAFGRWATSRACGSPTAPHVSRPPSPSHLRPRPQTNASPVPPTAKSGSPTSAFGCLSPPNGGAMPSGWSSNTCRMARKASRAACKACSRCSSSTSAPARSTSSPTAAAACTSIGANWPMAWPSVHRPPSSPSWATHSSTPSACMNSSPLASSTKTAACGRASARSVRPRC